MVDQEKKYRAWFEDPPPPITVISIIPSAAPLQLISVVTLERDNGLVGPLISFTEALFDPLASVIVIDSVIEH